MIPAPVLRSLESFPVLLWRCATPWLAISSGVHGGGIGPREWVLNATVESSYARPDPEAHVASMAEDLGLGSSGTGMLTAVDVRHEVTAIDDGVSATVTTGIGQPIWAAAQASERAVERNPAPGTINAVGWSSVRLSEAALVNAVATVAEAKAQALADAGVEGTGTVTDATVLLCPMDGPAQPYGGPRSRIGSALARAVHAGISAGLRAGDSRYRHR